MSKLRQFLESVTALKAVTLAADHDIDIAEYLRESAHPRVFCPNNRAITLTRAVSRLTDDQLMELHNFCDETAVCIG